LCFYADTVLAIVTGALYVLLKDTPGMKNANDLVKWNVIGILGHGLGHGGIAKYVRDNVTAGGPQVIDVVDFTLLTGADLVKRHLPGVLFWFPLLKASMSNVSSLPVLLMSVLSIVGSMLTPPRFGFTYTQTILMVAFSLNQLRRPKSEKTFPYALYAVLVSLPLGLIGWAESLACSNFVIHYGGHLIYDAFIPLSSILFYLCCYLKTRAEARIAKKLK